MLIGVIVVVVVSCGFGYCKGCIVLGYDVDLLVVVVGVDYDFVGFCDVKVVWCSGI